MRLPLASIYYPSYLCHCPPLLQYFLDYILLLGLELQETLLCSLSILFSQLCGFLGEATNTFLLSVHSIYNGRKGFLALWYRLREIFLFFWCLQFVIIENYSYPSSHEKIQFCGIWFAPPSKIPQDSICFQKMSMLPHTNNLQHYSLSCYNGGKQGKYCLRYTSWFSSSSCFVNILISFSMCRRRLSL